MNLAYVAGFIDADGCIGFAKNRSSVYPRLIITNTDKAVLEEMQTAFGGDIKPLSKRKDNWKQGYYLRLSWSKAVDLIAKVQPWLRIKQDQAAAIFAWDAIRLGTGKKTSDERQQYHEAIDFLLAYMTWLNKRGPCLEENPLDSEMKAIALSVAEKAKKKARKS
jgi:hypothetical protein